MPVIEVAVHLAATRAVCVYVCMCASVCVCVCGEVSRRVVVVVVVG